MTEHLSPERAKPATLRQSLRALPPGIWVLGLGSLFMDMSSELVHSLLPVFMVSVLGASMLAIGIIEGIAEATAAITKVFSGALSDFMKRRKFLIMLGYGLAAITKPIFPLATSIGHVAGARFIDRIGKGIRGAPRDALVADITPKKLRGAAYGLRQALDSAGAVLGPVLALTCMVLFANDIVAALWVGVIPGLIAVTLLAFALREPGSSRSTTVQSPGKKRLISLTAARQLTSGYWLVVFLGVVFNLARFSEAFLILRAEHIGLAMTLVPLVLIVMNLAYTFVAYPAGHAADRFKSSSLLAIGSGVLVLADLVLALSTSPWHVLMGATLWGLHMGLTQGLLSKLVADAAPTTFRGTAFGIFNLVNGVALLLASILAGVLWDRVGASATFIVGAVFAALTAAGILGARAKVAWGSAR